MYTEHFCKRIKSKSEWESTTLEEAVKNISGVGTLDKENAEKLLNNSTVIQTPYAIYRKGHYVEMNFLIDQRLFSKEPWFWTLNNKYMFKLSGERLSICTVDEFLNAK